MGQQVPVGRILMFCRALNDLSEAQLQYGFEETLKHLTNFIPGPGEIRKYAEDYKTAEWFAALYDASREILDRPDKPTGWGPIEPGELAKWLREGKAKAIARQKKLAADPDWQRMAPELGGLPGLKPKPIPSAIPEAPQERKAWAHQKAIEHGLIQDGQ